MKREILATAVLSGALLSGDTAPSTTDPAESKQPGRVGCTMLSMSAEDGRLSAHMLIEGFDPSHVDVALAGLWFSISGRGSDFHHIDESPQVSVSPDGGVVVATAMSNLQDLSGKPVNGQTVSSGFVQLNPNASQPYNGISCSAYSVVTFASGAPVSATPA